MEVIEGLIYRTDNRGLLKRTGLCYQRARCSLQERTHYKTYRKSRTLGVGQQHCLSFAIEAFCDTWFVIASFWSMHRLNLCLLGYLTLQAPLRRVVAWPGFQLTPTETGSGTRMSKSVRAKARTCLKQLSAKQWPPVWRRASRFASRVQRRV